MIISSKIILKAYKYNVENPKSIEQIEVKTALKFRVDATKWTIEGHRLHITFRKSTSPNSKSAPNREYGARRETAALHVNKKPIETSINDRC